MGFADFSKILDVLKLLYAVASASFTFKRKADSFESPSKQVTIFLINELTKGFPRLLILKKKNKKTVELATHLRPFLKMKIPDV